MAARSAPVKESTRLLPIRISILSNPLPIPVAVPEKPLLAPVPVRTTDIAISALLKSSVFRPGVSPPSNDPAKTCEPTNTKVSAAFPPTKLSKDEKTRFSPCEAYSCEFEIVQIEVKSAPCSKSIASPPINTSMLSKLTVRSVAVPRNPCSVPASSSSTVTAVV